MAQQETIDGKNEDRIYITKKSVNFYYNIR